MHLKEGDLPNGDDRIRFMQTISRLDSVSLACIYCCVGEMIWPRH